jgi:hypothetical protein
LGTSQVRIFSDYHDPLTQSPLLPSWLKVATCSLQEQCRSLQHNAQLRVHAHMSTSIQRLLLLCSISLPGLVPLLPPVSTRLYPATMPPDNSVEVQTMGSILIDIWYTNDTVLSLIACCFHVIFYNPLNSWINVLFSKRYLILIRICH